MLAAHVRGPSTAALQGEPAGTSIGMHAEAARTSVGRQRDHPNDPVDGSRKQTLTPSVLQAATQVVVRPSFAIPHIPASAGGGVVIPPSGEPDGKGKMQPLIPMMSAQTRTQYACRIGSSLCDGLVRQRASFSFVLL